MTRPVTSWALLAVLGWSAAASAQPSCDTCEHLCMWAPLLMSAEKTKQLFSNPDLVGGAESVKHLDGAVNAAMLAWQKSQGEVTDSPCYRIIVKDFYGDDPLASSQLNDVVSRLPPSGNLFHTEFDKPGCPVVPVKPGAEQLMCPALLDAYAKHEEVHKKQCQALWKKGGKKAAVAAFSSPQTFAASEVKAYDTQIKLMRDAMQKLINRKGCQVSTHSIEDFAPPPKNDTDVKKALDVGKALQMINDFNAQKGGGK